MAPPLVIRLHRLALTVAQRLRLAWWRVRRPDLYGCNVVVANAAGDIVLVRHSYQSSGQWMLPGGGLKRGESAEAAAIREVREEIGCAITSTRCFAMDTVALWGARNHIHLVAASTSDAPRPDGREIIEARFFPVNVLPDNTLESARNRIERWQTIAQNSES